MIDFVKSHNILRSLLAPLSPTQRRWRSFLHSLPLDPEQLSHPVAEPGEQNFIICGSPRTGTTLLSAILFQPPEVITVMEPWDGMRLPPAHLFASLRQEIRQTGTIRRGKLNIQTLQATGHTEWQPEGVANPCFSTAEDFQLGVKWPTYWHYLPLLPTTKFIICLRHPYEVIHSFQQVGGRLAQGLDYDTQFNQRMNRQLQTAIHDKALRRIGLYDYIHLRILPYLHHQNVFVVRYERWFTDAERMLEEIGHFLGKPLTMGHVRIQRSTKVATITAEEKALIQRYCQSAAALGYSF